MKCKVLAVVGARLNSSRLPAKHLLDLAGKPLIERLFQRLERVADIDRLLLATTDDAFNQPLVAWARDSGRDCFAFHGDVNDLMGRVDEVVRAEAPEILFYICGDSPLVEPALLAAMIVALRQNRDADMVVIKPGQGPVIHQGIHCYPIATWQKLMAVSRQPSEREHVGSAWSKLGPGLVSVSVEEAPIFFALEHRLSVDTPSDYRFMSRVYARWFAAHPRTEIVSLPWVIERLLAEPDLRAINGFVKQKAIGDRSVPVLLLTAAGPLVGLGHLRRMLALASALQDHQAAGVRLLICGEPFSRPELDLLPHRFCADPILGLSEERALRPAEVLVCDLPASLVSADLCTWLKQGGSPYLVSIDFSLPVSVAPHLQWVPSFFLASDASPQANLRYGWDCFLLQAPRKLADWSPEGEVVVLTGAGDVHGLGETLPSQLERALPNDIQITWLQGPFAARPLIPSTSSRWSLLVNPDDVGIFLDRARYAVVTYGVSFFECLARGLATVVFAPGQADLELMALDNSKVASRVNSAREAAGRLAELLRNEDAARGLADRARLCIDGQGPRRLAEIIIDGVETRQIVKPL